jgi:phosphotransferase system enzyme I (PtsP)
MLDVLRRIVQEVNAAEDLAHALDTIVQRIKSALKVDVCSVYLVTPGEKELVLMATEGLNPQATRKVHLKFSEGLVGLVAQRAEPLNLDNAPDHRRYKYIPETGEERYHAFLGIPIIHRRKLLGVLVIQQFEQRRFDEAHTAFLITLAAQLAGAISHAEISGEIQALRKKKDHPEIFIRGVTGAPGVGIGTAVVAFGSADLGSIPDRKPLNINREIQSFKRAVQRVQQEMLEIKERIGALIPSEERILFDAFVMLIGSDTLVDHTVEHIRAGNWALGALRQTIEDHVAVFESMDDQYLRERADDIRAIGRRILIRLQSNNHSGQRELPGNTVLIGEDVSVADLADISPDRLVGVVSGHGSRSSHVAILARALGVPAVMGAVDLPVGQLDGREVIVDGYTGTFYIEPSDPVREEFFRLEREEREFAEGLSELAGKPGVTPDGFRMPVYVNSGLLADINVMFQSDADGIGLYRTEFPFMVRDRFPGEEEQYHIYRQVLEAVVPKPVTLRTLDVGGDKVLPYFPINEDNPFLGWRGIRIMLDHPEIFLTQLRAMLRASVGLNNMKILLPMINSLSEVDEAFELVQRAWYELLDENFNVIMPDIGVMVEVPSAVYLSEKLARKVNFLSVGTNDLAQYILAVDRNNAMVAGLYHSMHPAVLDALLTIIRGAHSVGKPVGICGEMASDPAAVILLMGMEIDSLSVSLAGLPRVKWVIRSFTRSQVKKILKTVLTMDDPIEIRNLLDEALVRAGLGGLVRAGKH